jgi:hypothetical protein
VILEIDSEKNGSKKKGTWIAPKKELDNRFHRRGFTDEWKRRAR